MTNKNKSTERLFVYRVENLRRNFRLSSFIYFGFAFFYSFLRICPNDGFIFPWWFAIILLNLPIFLFLFVVISIRFSIRKLDLSLNKYYKYFSSVFSILFTLIFLYLPTAVIVNNKTCPFGISAFSPLAPIFLFLGFICFLVSSRRYIHLEILLSNTSEEIFGQQIFNKKDLINISKFERNFIFFNCWPLFYFIFVVLFSSLINLIKYSLPYWLRPGPANGSNLFLALQVMFFITTFLGPLIAYTYYFGPRSFIWVKKGFQLIGRIGQKFWRFNVKYSPSVKIYRIIRDKLRNN